MNQRLGFFWVVEMVKRKSLLILHLMIHGGENYNSYKKGLIYRKCNGGCKVVNWKGANANDQTGWRGKTEAPPLLLYKLTWL